MSEIQSPVSERFRPLVEKVEKAFSDHPEWVPIKQSFMAVREGKYCFCALGAAYANECLMSKEEILATISLEFHEDAISTWAYKQGVGCNDFVSFIAGFDDRPLFSYHNKDAYQAGRYLNEKYKPQS